MNHTVADTGHRGRPAPKLSRRPAQNGSVGEDPGHSISSSSYFPEGGVLGGSETGGLAETIRQVKA